MTAAPKKRVTAHTIDLEERRAEAIRLRSKSFSYREIAKRMEISISTAHSLVAAAYKEIIPAEEVELVRAAEMERIDRLTSHWLPIALQEQRIAVVTDQGDELMVPVPVETAVKATATLVQLSRARWQWSGAAAIAPESDGRPADRAELEATVLSLVGQRAEPAEKRKPRAKKD